MNKHSHEKYILLLLFIFFGSSTGVVAEGNVDIKIEQVRVILPPSVARTTAAYGVIRNTGSATDTLINISTNAGMVMLHKTEIIDGLAQMVHIDKFVLEAGAELVLKPMSYHLMFMHINHKVIKENGEVSLTLQFKEAGKIKIKVPVLTE